MRKFCRGLVACLVLISAVLIPAVQAQSTTAVAFRFWKSIDRDATKDEEIVAVPLDSDIYAATRAGFPDLRVVDEAQAEAPYLIESEIEFRQERLRQPFSTNIVTLRPDGNTIEIHLRLPDKSPDAEGFSFTTPLRNYERKVRVSGSADGASWTPLVSDGIIFDYSQFMDVSSREIPLPKNSFREFKITIEDVIDERESPFKELTRSLKDAKEEQRVERTIIERRPFRIDRIGAWGVATRERVQQIKTVSYPVVGFEAKDDPEHKQTVVTVRTRREPIMHFTLETSSRNFSRRAVVEVPVVHGENTVWQPITEVTIENFSFRNQNREQLTIAIPERREEEFRVVIRNEDNPPLRITGVQAEGIVQRVVFLAQPAKTYRIFYGSETAAAPRYEAATVLATLRQDNTPVMAKLGVQAGNSEFKIEPSQAVRSLINNWIFLGTALGLMVVVLGWCLFRAGQRLEGFPKE